MKFNSAFFASLLIFSLSQIAMNTDALATEPASSERWFEIEVILFKQLGDKSVLKEQFPDDITVTSLPNYPQSFDLLTPYLQPNLTPIKQFMPLCGEQNEQSQYLASWQSVSTPFPENITLAAAEQTQAVTFGFDLQKDVLAKPMFSTQNLCVITQNDIEHLFDKEQLADFKLDAFGVDSLPGKLYAAGAHHSDGPYLIADESLLLKDISQQLRWSKEFKPLLHFGWRQVGLTENKAIPVKLFAGKHYQYQYQQALSAYQKELKQANAIERNLLDILTQPQNTQITNQAHDDTANIASVNRDLLVKAKRKQQALNSLLSHVESHLEYTTDSIDNHAIDSNSITDIINHLDKQTLEDIISVNDAELTIDNKQLASGHKPKQPLQPWFLDGFFKVHLDHYLYITADFNVFNQDQLKLGNEDDKKLAAKLINFNQNRRVITGEIHYFDHPYIGMIVQIRRFDPTKPANEAVTQAIK